MKISIEVDTAKPGEVRRAIQMLSSLDTEDRPQVAVFTEKKSTSPKEAHEKKDEAGKAVEDAQIETY